MLTKIDPQGTHLTAATMPEALELLRQYCVEIVFLDIEMPGINGIEAAKNFMEITKELNIIFVTGHPEYSFEAFGVYPSGFLVKPVSEKDIQRELQHLRFPLKSNSCPLKIRCSPFGLFVSGQPFSFCRDRTIELFAYLIYKKGALCTNGELLGILWEGDPNKQGHLRQLVLDMRKCLGEIGAENMIIKKYGRIGVDFHAIQCEGDPEMIPEEYQWH